MDDRYTDDTFCGTGIPCSAMTRSFKNGSPLELLEKAKEAINPIAKDIVDSIKTIEQAEKAYNNTEDRKERDAILLKWIILCKDEQELADPMIRSPIQSLPEAAALQRTMEFKFS